MACKGNLCASHIFWAALTEEIEKVAVSHKDIHRCEAINSVQSKCLKFHVLKLATQLKKAVKESVHHKNKPPN